jgi:hypothetical protein
LLLLLLRWQLVISGLIAEVHLPRTPTATSPGPSLAETRRLASFRCLFSWCIIAAEVPIPSAGIVGPPLLMSAAVVLLSHRFFFFSHTTTFFFFFF